MRRGRATFGFLCVMAALAAILGLGMPAAADDARTPEAIIAEIDSTQPPKWDPSKKDDEAYIQEYSKKYYETQNRLAELAGELLAAAPTHERLEKLLPQRWQTYMWQPEKKDMVVKEMDSVIQRDPESKLAGEARYMKASFEIQDALWRSEEPSPDRAMAVAEAFAKAAPKDDRAGDLLAMIADSFNTQPNKQVALYERIKTDYPTSRSAKYASGRIRQVQSIGKPFELSFNDAITGKTVDMKDLRGKVVVVDFWATWCGPCVAEMPNMKKLYEEHHAKGLEIIGVSLDQPEDQGGLEKLKAFIEKEKITWHNYYQGKGWESEFSGSWGINGIPTMFIIDKQGNLRDTEARGKLEELVPKLLAE